MGIWIMKQNEDRLTYCDDICVSSNGEEGYSIINNKINCAYALGNYSSKEKALKVLKMIRNYILDVNYFCDIRVDADYEGIIETPNYGVFQMPRDDEVV